MVARPTVPARRRRALLLLALGILLFAAARRIGISDNLPGLILLLLGVAVLMLVPIQQWGIRGATAVVGSGVGFLVGALPGVKLGLVAGVPPVACPDCRADMQYMLIGGFLGMALLTPLAVHLLSQQRVGRASAYLRSIVISAVGLGVLFLGIAAQLPFLQGIAFLFTPLALVASAAGPSRAPNDSGLGSHASVGADSGAAGPTASSPREARLP